MNCIICECLNKPVSKKRGSSWNDLQDTLFIENARFRIVRIGISLVAQWLRICLELPWWCSGWESACHYRGHGFEPWSGKIPHAVELLSPCATITEPAHLERVPRNKRGRDSERPAHRDEEWPPLAATREAPAQKRRPNTAINK